MQDINSAVFPQKVEAVESSLPVQDRQEEKGPNFFKHGEQVLFMRPARVLDHLNRPGYLELLLETRGFLNRTTQTHETRLHQFLERPEEHGRIHMVIEFWSSSIFRVLFGGQEILVEEPEPAFPDVKARMLISQPEPNIEIIVEEDEQQITCTTTELQLRITKDPFHLEARDRRGQLFWSQRRSDLFTSDIFECSIVQHQERSGCFEAFELQPQEELFGLGERFDAVARRGRSVDFWNKDAIGTSNPRSYINVPFLFSTRGYGLFLNSLQRAEWDVGVSEAATLGFAVENKLLDYFVIFGPDPANILARYGSLTGFAPTPPIWSFGLWMSRCNYTSWEMVEEIATELRAREIPADVMHLDCAWFQEDLNCDLRFDPVRFGEPEKHLRGLKAQGFHTSLWQYNFIPPRDNNQNYHEALERGYYASGPDGKPFSYPEGTTGEWIDDLIIDFSNPEACHWYAEQIKKLIRLGAGTIKVDFGEGIPEEAHFQRIAGTDFHNLYSLVYTSVIAEAVYEVTGEHITWNRSGTAGSQRYPVHWGGDSQSSWSGLAGSVRAALSMGLSGFPYFSHDIGGFIGRPDAELYIRWAQFGLFSSHARCHGAGNPREPWSFGEEATRIFKRYDQLRYRLLPYLYQQSLQAARTLKPLVRALVIDYPRDRNTWRLDDQYLFGDAFLIAPILQPLGTETVRHLYLPAGTWYDYWTKRAYHSHGEWIERPIDIDTMPIYVKEGSLLPYTALRQHTHNEIGPIERLEIYGTGDTRLTYDDGSTSFNVKVEKGKATLVGLEQTPELTIYTDKPE